MRELARPNVAGCQTWCQHYCSVINSRGSLGYAEGSKSVIWNFWSKSVNKVHLRIKVSLQTQEGMSKHFFLLEERRGGEGPGLPLTWSLCLSRAPGDTGRSRCPQLVITPCRVSLVPACQAKPTCQSSMAWDKAAMAGNSSASSCDWQEKQ